MTVSHYDVNMNMNIYLSRIPFNIHPPVFRFWQPIDHILCVVFEIRYDKSDQIFAKQYPEIGYFCLGF